MLPVPGVLVPPPVQIAAGEPLLLSYNKLSKMSQDLFLLL
jgi:hypothetical protein